MLHDDRTPPTRPTNDTPLRLDTNRDTDLNQAPLISSWNIRPQRRRSTNGASLPPIGQRICSFNNCCPKLSLYSNLSLYIKRKHKRMLRLLNDPNANLQCPARTCNRRFKLRDSLCSHVRRVHQTSVLSTSLSYPCSLKDELKCNAAFRNRFWHVMSRISTESTTQKHLAVPIPAPRAFLNVRARRNSTTQRPLSIVAPHGSMYISSIVFNPDDSHVLLKTNWGVRTPSLV